MSGDVMPEASFSPLLGRRAYWALGLLFLLLVFCHSGGSPIAGVYHNPQWRLAGNMGMRDFGSDYILFQGGDAWRDPKQAPQGLNVAEARRQHAKDWGRWRRSGDTYYLRMPASQGEKKVQMLRYEPAPRGEHHVEGRWSSNLSFVSVVPGMSTSGVAGKTLTLHRNGRFEQEGAGSFSFNGTAAGGTFQSTQPRASGRYSIEGYGLELQYDDGRVERVLFYWAGGEAKRYEMVRINGASYLGGLTH